jgi:hypothetical protein
MQDRLPHGLRAGCLFERFTRLHEAGDQTVHAGFKMRLCASRIWSPRKMAIMIAGEIRGKVMLPQTSQDLGSLVGFQMGRRAAAAAETGLLIPVQNLRGPAGQSKDITRRSRPRARRWIRAWSGEYGRRRIAERQTVTGCAGKLAR